MNLPGFTAEASLSAWSRIRRGNAVSYASKSSIRLAFNGEGATVPFDFFDPYEFSWMETNGVGPINTENWWELFEGEEGFVDPETALILADLALISWAAYKIGKAALGDAPPPTEISGQPCGVGWIDTNPPKAVGRGIGFSLTESGCDLAIERAKKSAQEHCDSLAARCPDTCPGGTACKPDFVIQGPVDQTSWSHLGLWCTAEFEYKCRCACL